MSIFPLTQFEADLKEYRAEKQKGRLGQTGDDSRALRRDAAHRRYTYTGDIRPGCGSKMVVRTHRGTELAELLTSTCPNAGCSKSVTRQEMLEYIENSGGRDYPVSNEGRAVRLATASDMAKQADLEATIPDLVRSTRQLVKELGLDMKIVDADPILGGERLTFFFMAEDRIDFRELVQRLAETHHTRIDLRQIGARDEARLTADYERCGQHCCCKQFLKVLKPVSIKSAKQQKATLDPLKISGRCGRLMCCLRYEDQTYKELKQNLPHRKSRVGTPDGPGIVVDSQILTQIVLVELDHSRQRIAVPIEELMDPDAAPVPEPLKPVAPKRPRSGSSAARRPRERNNDTSTNNNDATPKAAGDSEAEGTPKKRRRRRGRRRKPGGGTSDGGNPSS